MEELIQVTAQERSQSSLSDIAYTRIRKLIDAGVYKPNSKLPSEAELVHRLGISRTIIRRALSRLKEEGTISSLQGSGSYVNLKSEEALGYPSLVPVAAFGPISTLSDLKRCYDFRIGIESEAAAQAAINRTDEQLRELLVVAEMMDIADDVIAVGAEADFRFHNLVASATGNSFYTGVFALLRQQIITGISISRTLWSIESNSVRIDEIVTQHRSIVEAIRDRNGDLARERMRAHIDQARSFFLRGHSLQSDKS